MEKTVSAAIRHPIGVAIALSMAPATALGYARFAYSLLLPDMRIALHWSYLQAGTMNTVNAAGYLVGALIASPLSRRFGLGRTFRLAALMMVITLAATAAVSGYYDLLVLRSLSGLFGSTLFVVGSGIAQSVALGVPSFRAPAVLGSYFAGAGVGTAISGIAIPSVVWSASLWPAGWLVLAGISGASLLLASAAARRVGEPARGDGPSVRGSHYFKLLPTFIAYGLFGLGYMTFLTYQVAYMRHAGLSESRVVLVYVAMGVSVTAGVFVWHRPLGRLRPHLAAALVYSTAAVGSAIFLISSGLAAEVLGSFLFGICLMTTSTVVSLFSRRLLPATMQTGAMGVATIFIGAGQAIGPILGGVASTSAWGLRGAVGVGVAGIVASAAIGSLQRG